MADVNWLQRDTDESYSSEGSSGGAGGSEVNTGDQNEDTYYSRTYGCGVGQCPVVGALTVITVTFSQGHPVNKLQLVLQTQVDVSGQQSHGWKMEMYYAGEWHEMNSGQQGSGIGKTMKTVEFSQINGVTKVRMTAICSGATNWGGGLACSWIYEIYAWGPSYKDIGLRVSKSGLIIKIGAMDLEASHKLRVRKNSTTYGIPFVDPGAPEAGPIRIYDGSSIKSLPKMD